MQDKWYHLFRAKNLPYTGTGAGIGVGVGILSSWLFPHIFPFLQNKLTFNTSALACACLAGLWVMMIYSAITGTKHWVLRILFPLIVVLLESLLLLCNPFHTELKFQLYWAGLAALFILILIAGGPQESTPPSDGYLTKESFARLREDIWRKESDWSRILVTISSLILTACGAYYYMLASPGTSKMPQQHLAINTPIALLAISAAVNFASTFLLHFSEFFSLSLKGDSVPWYYTFIQEMNHRLHPLCHIAFLVCCAVQFASLLYIIVAVAC